MNVYITKVKNGDLPQVHTNEEVIKKLNPIQKKLMFLLINKIMERLGTDEKKYINLLSPDEQLEFNRLSTQISDRYAYESKKPEASLSFNLKALSESGFSIYQKTKKDKHMILLFENLFKLQNLIFK